MSPSYEEVNSTWCELNSYFSCSRVRESPFAHIGPIPTAAVGLAGFVILLALAAMSLRGVERIWRWSPDPWLVGFAALGASLGAGPPAGRGVRVLGGGLPGPARFLPSP